MVELWDAVVRRGGDGAATAGSGGDKRARVHCRERAEEGKGGVDRPEESEGLLGVSSQPPASWKQEVARARAGPRRPCA